METPIISVVIPAYNAAGFVAEAIASACAQSEERIEIIVVDDGSTDDTAAGVAALAAGDGRIRLLRMPENRGPAAARNRGFRAARGAWIATLDADDRILPHRLRSLLALAEANGADMISDNLMLCPWGDAAGAAPMIPPALLDRPRRIDAAEFVRRNVGSRRHPRVSYGFMHPMLRRAFLQAHGLEYDERNRFAEDYMFYVACLMRGAIWFVTPEPMYLYCVRGGSLTEIQTSEDLDRIRRFEERLMAQAAVRADRRLMAALRRHKAVIERCYYYRAFTDAVKAGRHAAAARLLFESPRSFAHIANESLAQAPVIARKAMRGGYRRKAAA